MSQIKKEDIKQEVFDLYDDYAHNRLDRRLFVQLYGQHQFLTGPEKGDPGFIAGGKLTEGFHISLHALYFYISQSYPYST